MSPGRLLAILVVAGLWVGCATPGETPAASDWSLDCSWPSRSPGWNEPCVVQASDKAWSQAETWIAVDPTDARTVILGAKDMDPALSNRCVWTSYALTHDAGATWTPWVPGGTFLDRRPADPSFGYACNTDPMAKFAPDGTLYVVQDLYGFGVSPSTVVAATARMELYASDDGGRTWPRSVPLILGEGGAVAPDYPRMALVPTTGTLLVSFIDYMGGNRCYVTGSDDRGATARVPVVIPVAGARGCLLIAASPAGTVIVGGATELLDGRDGGTWFARSEDDGRSFGEAERGPNFGPVAGFSENAFVATSTTELVYDVSDGPFGGRLYLVIAGHSAPPADDANVFLWWSDDDGMTWSEPTRVDQDEGTSDQWLPNVAVAPDGSVHVAWMDKRYDPGNRLIDIMHAVSVDGGATWKESRITRSSFDGDLGRHQNSNEITGPVPYIGDYLGIDAIEGEVWIGLPTSHMGGPPVMAAARLTKT